MPIINTNFYDFIGAWFGAFPGPVGSLLAFVCVAAIVLAVINIILTLIWVINQFKGLIIP